MHRHAYFDLWLHDDDELGPLVQGEIVERVTLHEWPLSSVQRLTLSGGRTRHVRLDEQRLRRLLSPERAAREAEGR